MSTGFSSVSRDIHSAYNSNKKCFVIRHLANLKMRCICSQGKIILICYNTSLFTNHFDLLFRRCLFKRSSVPNRMIPHSSSVSYSTAKHFRIFCQFFFFAFYRSHRAKIIRQTAWKSFLKYAWAQRDSKNCRFCAKYTINFINLWNGPKCILKNSKEARVLNNFHFYDLFSFSVCVRIVTRFPLHKF